MLKACQSKLHFNTTVKNFQLYKFLTDPISDYLITNFFITEFVIICLSVLISDEASDANFLNFAI